MKLDDLKDELFIQHDVNLFNFVIYLNKALHEQGRELELVRDLDLSMVNPCPLSLAQMPHARTNFIDLQTAIEIFTPIYQLMLTDNDFWRGCNSLQLDETIGLYAARLTGMPEHLVMLNNRHPLGAAKYAACGVSLGAARSVDGDAACLAAAAEGATAVGLDIERR